MAKICMQKMFPIFDNKAFDIKQIRNENVLKRKSSDQKKYKNVYWGKQYCIHKTETKRIVFLAQS